MYSDELGCENTLKSLWCYKMLIIHLSYFFHLVWTFVEYEMNMKSKYYIWLYVLWNACINHYHSLKFIEI